MGETVVRVGSSRGMVGWLGWAALAILAVAMGVVGLRFLTFNPQVLTEELRPNLLNHPASFYLHTIMAPVAMLIGIWQFLPVTRRSRYHRWAGRIYVACVGLGSITGFTIAITTEVGAAAGVGFMILAALWFGSTARAWLLATSGRYAEHRVWMVRSYALTCAAITLRIILPVGMASGFGFAQSYIVAAWGSWIINLAVAEWIIRTDRNTEVPERPPLSTIAQPR